MAKKKKEEEIEIVEINGDEADEFEEKEESQEREDEEKKVREEGRESSVDVQKEENKKRSGRKRGIKALVFLLVLLFVVDALSLYAYYKPELPKFTGFSSVDESVPKCKDKTPEGECSKEKPYYCSEGELLKKAYTCGCPAGYKVDFQGCKKI